MKQNSSTSHENLASFYTLVDHEVTKVRNELLWRAVKPECGVQIQILKTAPCPCFLTYARLSFEKMPLGSVIVTELSYSPACPSQSMLSIMKITPDLFQPAFARFGFKELLPGNCSTAFFQFFYSNGITVLFLPAFTVFKLSGQSSLYVPNFNLEPLPGPY